MSASLVGSEMCIRDRRCTQPLSAGQTPARLGRLREAGPRLGGRMHCWAPVSYTHLTLPTICSV
eukprot:9739769-Alexandrium_andersonii.AAC.1